ncbi:MAG: hypothetical protein HY657_06820 [Acidobacteria bacterium]|nr:hypothetical protein [Acidobacteriota bacterium]
MRIGRAVLSLLMVLGVSPAWAAEHPALAKARALYNAADYDGAIAAAAVARSDPMSADAAALVVGRAHLERYRLQADAADLTGAREALNAVRAPALSPRDQLDLLVGLGQWLYLGEAFGAAAELFDTALSRASMLADRDRLLLLDWWATAMDREAQRRAPEDRGPLFARILGRMETELRDDAGNPTANYWLAASARGLGDLDRAWSAAIAGWVRAILRPETSERLRADVDRLVTEALIPERARTKPAREQQDAVAALRAEWESLKQQWE